MSFSDSGRHAEDLRDACTWAREQFASGDVRDFWSAFEVFTARVENIADRIAPPKVVPISAAWGFDRRQGWSVRVSSPQRDHSKEGA